MNPDLSYAVEDFSSKMASIVSCGKVIDASFRFLPVLKRREADVSALDSSMMVAVSRIADAPRDAENPGINGLVVGQISTFEVSVTEIIAAYWFARSKIGTSFLAKDDIEMYILKLALLFEKKERVGWSDSEVDKILLGSRTADDGTVYIDFWPRVFGTTQRNLSSSELQRIFRDSGFSKIWDSISTHQSMMDFYQSENSATVQVAARRKLDEIVKIRNIISHRGFLDYSIGTNIIEEYAGFLIVVFEVIASILNSDLELRASTQANG